MSAEQNTPMDQVMKASLEHARRLLRAADRKGAEAAINQDRVVRGIGLGLKSLRLRHGMNLREVSDRMGAIEPKTEIPWMLVFQVEQGLIPLEDVREDFMDRYHQVLPPISD